MEAYFNVKLTAAQELVWFTELRESIGGWSVGRNMDPTKDAKAREINESLCDTIRYISGLENIPRSNDGGRRGGFAGNPTVKDLKLWVFLHRESENAADSGGGSTGFNYSYVSTVTDAIERLISEGHKVEAAIVATGNPAAYCDVERLGANRGPTPEEQENIEAFCNRIGFDPHNAFRGRR